VDEQSTHLSPATEAAIDQMVDFIAALPTDQNNIHSVVEWALELVATLPPEDTAELVNLPSIDIAITSLGLAASPIKQEIRVVTGLMLRAMARGASRQVQAQFNQLFLDSPAYDAPPMYATGPVRTIYMGGPGAC
jgi:hypothetical protein